MADGTLNQAVRNQTVRIPRGLLTVSRHPRMHERVLFWRDLSVPHFRPPAACKSSLRNEGPCRASRPAHVWSALRGNELRQKVLWVPRKDARRRADFCGARYEQCRASGRPCRRFSRQALPLRTEIGKLHAPPGTLPWVWTHLLRSFTPTGEADGDAQ